jgi:hypothetical protein
MLTVGAWALSVERVEINRIIINKKRRARAVTRVTGDCAFSASPRVVTHLIPILVTLSYLPYPHSRFPSSSLAYQSSFLILLTHSLIHSPSQSCDLSTSSLPPHFPLGAAFSGRRFLISNNARSSCVPSTDQPSSPHREPISFIATPITHTRIAQRAIRIQRGFRSPRHPRLRAHSQLDSDSNHRPPLLKKS